MWFQGQDRQMIPFDRVTGALRLDVELFAEIQHEAHSESRDNEDDSASQGQWLLQCFWNEILS